MDQKRVYIQDRRCADYQFAHTSLAAHEDVWHAPTTVASVISGDVRVGRFSCCSSTHNRTPIERRAHKWWHVRGTHSITARRVSYGDMPSRWKRLGGRGLERTRAFRVHSAVSSGVAARDVTACSHTVHTRAPQRTRGLRASPERR